MFGVGGVFVNPAQIQRNVAKPNPTPKPSIKPLNPMTSKAEDKAGNWEKAELLLAQARAFYGSFTASFVASSLRV